MSSYSSIIEDINWGLLIIAICGFLCYGIFLINKSATLENNHRQIFMSDCVKAGNTPAECGAAWRVSKWGN